MSPFFIRAFDEYKKLTSKDWWLLIAITIVSSVGGTLLFTEALGRSFAVYDFATPILLQKLQPIFVILLAGLWLKEKITLRFLALVIVAIIGGYLISFGSETVSLAFEGKSAIVWLSIGAAAAWGSGTVMSKEILNKLSFSGATAIRFLLAIPFSFIAVQIFNQGYSVGELQSGHVLRFLIIAFTTGAGAVVIYYRGLKVTEAKVSTIAELTFPIVSILIAISVVNPYGEVIGNWWKITLHKAQDFSLANVFGIILLLISMLIISFDYHVKDVASKK